MLHGILWLVRYDYSKGGEISTLLVCLGEVKIISKERREHDK